MKINQVYYIASYDRESICPKTKIPEYAFIGRSNVGKSSLINMLTGRKDLARVSKSPGKTSMINYFRVDDNWHLVDLPGYGYAKVSKKQRAKWENMIERFLITREQLACTFLLIDSRIPFQKIDREFMNWLGERKIPFVLVFTKTDRIKPAEREEKIKSLKAEMLEHWEELPTVFITSSTKREGKEELLTFIEGINNQIAQGG